MTTSPSRDAADRAGSMKEITKKLFFHFNSFVLRCIFTDFSELCD